MKTKNFAKLAMLAALTCGAPMACVYAGSSTKSSNVIKVDKSKKGKSRFMQFMARNWMIIVIFFILVATLAFALFIKRQRENKQ